MKPYSYSELFLLLHSYDDLNSQQTSFYSEPIKEVISDTM